jgi:diguanylate cyclase (GGDEF)-like protein
LIFVVIAHFITKYENSILSKIIDRYEAELNEKNIELKNLNYKLKEEVQEKTNQLVKNLFIDPLTKLPNREKLLVDFEFKKFVAILNIDSFKEINDFYGIEIGDRVLKEIGNILSLEVELYKLAGDEFAILDDNIENITLKVENLMKVIENSKIIIDENISIEWTMSCGIADNLSQADIALKYAKQTKQKIVVFDNQLPLVKEYENNLKWKNIIKKAIKNDNIVPYIQPLVNSNSKKIDKFECLIRLKEGDRVYSPYFFLEISKKTGQYQELQKIMIKKSFEKFKNLDYKFSINLSTNDLNSIKFQEYFINMIDEYGVEDKVIVELLEDDGLLYPEIIGFLIVLNQMGVEVAIDDFGSGYSNFSYLITKLPVTILKIDGTLVKNIANDDKSFRLLKTIVNMAKEFDLSVIAEFVENKEIVELLETLDIDYYQGYYFSAPFDMDEL